MASATAAAGSGGAGAAGGAGGGALTEEQNRKALEAIQPAAAATASGGTAPAGGGGGGAPSDKPAEAVGPDGTCMHHHCITTALPLHLVEYSGPLRSLYASHINHWNV